MTFRDLKIYWRPFIHLFNAITATCIICNNPRQMATGTQTRVFRLLSVPGFNDRQNDIVFCKSKNSPAPISRVIFFAGDSQDYPEQMEAHRDNHRFSQWNLINTAEILSNRFDKSDIYVIKPSQMHLKSFSCYSNFIESSIVGAPTHCADYNAIVHLSLLIGNGSVLAAREVATERGDLDVGRQVEVPVVLIGFSKGSVVLNQIVHELHLVESDGVVERFVSSISEFYWLDGGNPGGSETWVTSLDLLKRLAALDVKIFVYVTPYQINDHHRPWLKKEEKIFSDTLKRLNAQIDRKVFFENDPRDIMLHFKLLEQF